MTYPSYLEMPERVPRRAWQVLRVGSVVGTIALIVVLVVDPADGLDTWWRLLVPLLPAVWFLAPGLWRNLCPLAALNQLPRTARLTRGLALPPLGHRYAYVIAVVAFLALVPMRKPLLEGSGTATAALIGGALVLAFAGGLVFRGKSGWCGSVCPLLPVQRLYGQAPFEVVRNSHCPTCVGCTVNCYDFNPRVAQIADLHDDERAPYRKLFAGIFPGFVAGFFLTPADASWATAYGTVALAAAASLASLVIVDALVRPMPALLTAVFGAAALNVFYGYAVPRLVTTSASVVWPLRVALGALTVVWLVRVHRTETAVADESSEELAFLEPATTALLREAGEGHSEVVIGGRRIAVDPGTTILEVLERHGLAIQSGCRMGVCGADPITIVTGGDTLSPVTASEGATLERLGLGPGTRLACCARVGAEVEVSLETSRAVEGGATPEYSFAVATDVERVVIVGNGIAGVTAADYVRRAHPSCRIDVIARERYHLYNRMAITRLVHGHGGLHGLFLLPEEWYEERAIRVRLTTTVDAVDLDERVVLVATGESLPYDRLILTTGSSGSLPPIDGFGKRGTYALRTADDAMLIREELQACRARTAVVLGGGLLGIEAAVALQKFGLGVTVVHRGERLLDRQLDAAAARYLRAYLEGLGVEFVLGTEIREIAGDDRVRSVRLADGTEHDADVVLAAIGITPNLDVPRLAGLEVARGLVVDDRMQTSDAHVFAAGDIAEHRGVMVGQWPIAVEQGRVAALNALGGDELYVATPEVTMLKVSGVDHASIGLLSATEPGDEEIVVEEPTEGIYRKLVVRHGRAVGGIVLGSDGDSPALVAAVQEGRDLGPVLDRIRAGDWAVLAA
jgi:NADPH-dependent 2,4-dienoyl-CoA reductase/sulfur reductase-like enzyme/ferredoxin